MIFIIPITTPFGIENSQKELEFETDLNLFREFSKHKGRKVKFKVRLEEGLYRVNEDVNHSGIVMPAKVVNYCFLSANETPKQSYWTMHIETSDDLKKIFKEYSAPEDIERDTLYAIACFLQGVLNIFGYARVTPIIIISDGLILFNSKLAHLINPYQDWFRGRGLLSVLLDIDLYRGIGSESERYPIFHSHLVPTVVPIDWEKVCSRGSEIATEEIFGFGKILSEIVRQHPSIDYVAMVSLLTAYTEGLLKIKGDNTYKFSIKISNLFNDVRLASATKKIYEMRSNFFHSAMAKGPDSLFHFVDIEFLILVIKSLLQYNFDNPIQNTSFDFPSKKL